MSLPGDWPEWCTARELAARWNMHPSTIYRMHHDDPENFGRMLRGQLRIHKSMIEARERLEVHEQAVKTIRTMRRQRFSRPSGIDHFAPRKPKRRTSKGEPPTT